MRTVAFVAASLVLLATAASACSDDSTDTPATTDAGPGTDASSIADSSTPAKDAAGDDAGEDAAAAGLGPGPYSLAYAGVTVGVDMRPVAAGKATFDGIGMTGYEASADERPTSGSAKVVDTSGDAFAAIGRWAGGTTGGKFYNAGDAGAFDVPANGGFHYAIGVPADPLPSGGAAKYTLSSKTPATVVDGTMTPGILSGELTADLAGAATKIGFSLTLDVPGDATYKVETTGGAANPSTTEAMVAGGMVKGAFFANLSVTSAGGACSGGGSCTGAVDGFVAGPNGERIALVVHVYAGSGGAPKSVAAAAIFTKP